MTLEIVIDELLVRGLPAEHARRVAEAFEARLGALAAGATVSPRAESFRRLPSLISSPDAIGVDVAEAVWASLGGRGER